MIPVKTFQDLFPSAMASVISPPQGITLPWWPRMNEFVGGLRKHELTLLCAPTGAGKTALLANVVAQMMESATPTLAVPVETGDIDFVTRVTSAIVGQDINDGRPLALSALSALTSPHRTMLEASQVLVAGYDNRVDVMDMVNLMTKLNGDMGIELAVLDNLNFLLNVSSAQNALIEMDRAVHELVMHVKRIPMHVILVVHPKKTEGGRVESEFDIKGSSTAVQEAANVILFNRPKPVDIEQGARLFSDRELVFKKIRRRGQNVNKPLWFGFKNYQYREYLK